MEKETQEMKFCKYCGAKIPIQAVICTNCGGQVEELRQPQQSQQPNIVINNSNANSNVNTNRINGNHGRSRNKWIAFLLCLFLGYAGAHKFYEGRIGMGILYLLTVGIFGIGWLVDIIILLFKPNPYYV